jgi:hypothetical protein
MFRQGVYQPIHQQEDHSGVKAVYGIQNGDLSNQDLGYMVATEGKCVAFPNVYQHKVAPFELVDKKKKGHRKILVFFLVDPTKRVISTKNVAPQQPDWNDVQFGNGNNVVRRVMTLEEARKYREDLMSERKFFRDEFEREIFERHFSLCEH